MNAGKKPEEMNDTFGTKCVTLAKSEAAILVTTDCELAKAEGAYVRHIEIK